MKNKLISNKLIDYPIENKKKILKNERHKIVNTISELNFFIDESLTTNFNKSLHLGLINIYTIIKIINNINYLPKSRVNYLQLSCYDLVINQSEIRHIKSDKLRMINEDVSNYIKKLVDIVIDFDEVFYTKQKEEAIRFLKEIENCRYYVVVIVSNKKHTFTVKTIYMNRLDYENKKKKHISTD